MNRTTKFTALTLVFILIVGLISSILKPYSEEEVNDFIESVTDNSVFFRLWNVGSATPRVDNMKIELLENPYGLNTKDPAFSWIMLDSDYNAVQTAYQIQIVKREIDQVAISLLSSGGFVDTGKVESSESTYVKVEDIENKLDDNELYYWRVRIWDNEGEKSAWSSYQAFSTAVGEWEGYDGIWHVARSIPLNYEEEENDGVDFSAWSTVSPTAGTNYAFIRREFEITHEDYHKIEKALVSVTGLSPEDTRQFVYNLHMNGEFVGLGPTRIGTESEYPTDGVAGTDILYYNTYDVTELLNNGENAIGAINFAGSEKMFLCQMTLFYKDGSKEVILSTSDTDESTGLSKWESLDGADSMGSRTTNIAPAYWYKGYPYDMDATVYPYGWDAIDFDNTGWSYATIKGDIRSTTGTYILAPYDADNVEKNYINPQTVEKIADGHYIITFEKEIIGGFALELDVPTNMNGIKMDIRYGEELDDDGSVKYAMITANTYREYWTVKEGEQWIENLALMGYRYVEILDCPVELTKNDIYGVSRYQKFSTEESSFQSSDTLLNEIYDFVKYSIQATNQDLYVDTQTRERGAYEGDAIINALSSYAFEDDYSLARFSNEYLASNRTWCLEYVFYTTILAWYDYMYTGNPDSLYEYFDMFVDEDNIYLRQNSFVDNLNSTYGLLEVEVEDGNSSNGWDSILVDWPITNRDDYVFTGAEYNTVMNAVGYAAFDSLSKMAEVIGKTEDANYYSEIAATIKEGMITYLYNEELGAYADGLTEDGTKLDGYSQHASAFALAYGIYEGDEMKEALAKSIEDDGYIKTSPYGAYFLLSGLFNIDAGDIAMDYMLETEGTNNWYHVIHNLGATISTEAWDPSIKVNMTYSHAWSTAPASQIVTGMFGIQPTVPGFEEFTIKFQPGDVEWAELTVPSIKGSIEAEYEQAPGEFKGKITIPANSKAIVSVPDMGDSDSSTIKVNGVEKQATRVGGFLVVELGSGTYTLEVIAKAIVGS